MENNTWTNIMQRMYGNRQTCVVDGVDSDGVHYRDVIFIHEEDGPDTAVEVHAIWKEDMNHAWIFTGPRFVDVSSIRNL